MFCIIPLDMLPEFRGILTGKSLCSPVIRNVDIKATELLKSVVTYEGQYKYEAIRGMLLVAFSIILENATFTEKSNLNETTIGAILNFCEKHYKEEITIEMIAKNLGVSKSYISHIFSKKMHMSFRDYINSMRLNVSLQFLNHSGVKITDIAAEAGFGTIRTFNRAFKREFGMSPREYIKREHIDTAKCL